MSGLKPIETAYKGICFRSRLEARWALFFDKIGVPWEYEKEGYDLDGIWYLPDFWMPKQDCYIEVKGVSPTLEEQCKASVLCDRSHKRVYIFGPLPLPETYMHLTYNDEFAIAFIPWVDENGDRIVAGDFSYYWCQCKHCGAFGIEYNGRAGRIKCCDQNMSLQDDKGYNSATDRLVYAYNAARNARF